MLSRAQYWEKLDSSLALPTSCQAGQFGGTAASQLCSLATQFECCSFLHSA